MMRKRKWVAAGLVLALAAVLSAGCGTETKKKQAKGAQQSRNDGEALTVLVRNHVDIGEKLQEKFPDIPIEVQHYDGKNTTSNFQMLVANQEIPDIFLGTLSLGEADAKRNLLDLSGYEFCDRYELSILKQYDIDGRIYQLPSAVTIRSIIYNKKMFEEHGWEEPETFGELTALCRQIREETDDITPIVFGGAGIGYYFTTMTTYAQTEFLYTPEGKQWEINYQKGNAKAEEGFGKGIQMTQELIDAGAFDYEKNGDLWDVELFQKRMENGEAAMQFAWGGQHELFGLLEGKEKEYGVMPFRNYAGDAFIGTATSYNIGLSKRLGEEGNEKKLANAVRIMEWLATEEGQGSLNIINGSVVFPIKGATNRQIIPQFRELWDENLDGIKAPMLYTGYEDIILPASEYIVGAFKGEHDLSGLASYIDEVHKETVENTEKAHIGHIAEDFTHEETVQMMAEILHSRRDSDITLVSDGRRKGEVPNESGAHSEFYRGDMRYEWLTVFEPGDSVVENLLVQMRLTGAQIRELLENGKQRVQYEDGEEKVTVYDYYWAGMTAELADGKVLSMKLSDGEGMEDGKTYTVTFAHGDYTEETAQAGSPKTLDGKMEELFIEYLKENSPLKPLKAQR